MTINCRAAVTWLFVWTSYRSYIHNITHVWLFPILCRNNRPIITTKKRSNPHKVSLNAISTKISKAMPLMWFYTYPGKWSSFNNTQTILPWGQLFLFQQSNGLIVIGRFPKKCKFQQKPISRQVIRKTLRTLVCIMISLYPANQQVDS